MRKERKAKERGGGGRESSIRMRKRPTDTKGRRMTSTKVRPAWRNEEEGDGKDGWSVEEEREFARIPEFSFRYFITVALWED